MSQTVVHKNDSEARTNQTSASEYGIFGTYMPAWFNCFIIVEQVGKDGMLVRHLWAHPGPFNELPHISKGLFPKDFSSGVSLTEHLMGKNESPFISASSRFPAGGYPQSKDQKIFVDIAKLKAQGAVMVQTEDLVKLLQTYKKQYPHNTRIDKVIMDVRKTMEVTIEPVPRGNYVHPSGVWTPQHYTMYQRFAPYARVVQVFGVALTGYHLGAATRASWDNNTIRPLSAEAVRQAGGWGGMWLGAKVGAAAGALVGIETGPGALVTGAVGGIIFGVAGYWGADWVADFIYEN